MLLLANVGEYSFADAEINATGPDDDKSALAQVMAQRTQKTFIIHQTFVRWALLKSGYDGDLHLTHQVQLRDGYKPATIE